MPAAKQEERVGEAFIMYRDTDCCFMKIHIIFGMRFEVPFAIFCSRAVAV